MKLKANLLDDNAIRRSLIRISHEIIEKNKGVEDIVLIGIKRRGYPLAKRIAENIEKIEGVSVEVGYVDISLYRDDITEIKESPKVNSVDLGAEVKGKKVILVDDVLFIEQLEQLLKPLWMEEDHYQFNLQFLLIEDIKNYQLELIMLVKIYQHQRQK